MVMTMLLYLPRDAFKFAKIPNYFYEAKNTINKLCLDYVKIDACPNDCMLCWEDDIDKQKCKYSHTSRWKPDKKSNKIFVSATGKKKQSATNKKQKKKPAKVLHYFPLKSRLQRLFMCSKTAEHMRWHAEDGNKDGIIRHPRDGEAWKRFLGHLKSLVGNKAQAEGSIAGSYIVEEALTLCSRYFEDI
ncbi:uncharacterized protein [Nicotiana tomentosiformis]|uniref:uncharacterized protein isoform X2 n=1 Tax=Nicotiana tomentosiformis TaxID=4098 RepID=UPI00388C5539